MSLEFFLNDGSLSVNELIHQFFHVKYVLNNMGIRSIMLEMDAGGNNTRLGSLLRHKCKLDNKGWLGGNQNLLSFKDPIVYHAEREMCTSVVPCATRNQKSLRNAFRSSFNMTHSTRCFQS